MTLEVDPGLVALFGSQTRVRTLAPLACSPSPLTAYRVAWMTGVQRTKVYSELRRLAAAGVVAERKSGGNRSTWELVDPEVRSLLRRRARISWSEDWLADLNRDAGKQSPIQLQQQREDFFRRVRRPKSVPRAAKAILAEMKRRPGKDVELARLGLATSPRSRRVR
jgi:DNA-binding transcriptional ArsR family regulator